MFKTVFSTSGVVVAGLALLVSGTGCTKKLTKDVCESWMGHISDLAEKELNAVIESKCKGKKDAPGLSTIKSSLDQVRDGWKQACSAYEQAGNITYKAEGGDCIMKADSLKALSDCKVENFPVDSFGKGLDGLRQGAEAACSMPDMPKMPGMPH
jgi:hypothetical protein